MSYSSFARFYDGLTENVDYPARAAYFSELFLLYGKKPKTLLDLACGTASLSVELAKLGYSIIASDSSEEMLIEASQKIGEHKITLLHQSMEELDLPFKVDGAVCALDSLNHLPNVSALSAVFQRLGQFLKPKGLFIFDVNSQYKHKVLLGNNAYIFENESVFCSWQNELNDEDLSVNIFLDFFTEQPNGSYLRESEDFSEQFFSHDQLGIALQKAGFEIVSCFGEDSFDHPKEKDERLVYIARKLI